MPYPNEHSCRLRESIDGAKTNRKNGEREHNGKKYDVIYQQQKDGAWEDQAFRYPKDTWGEDEARNHCKDHKGILFEPAEKEKEKGEEVEEEKRAEDKKDEGPYNCECVECGHKMTSEKHCREIKCEKCGGEMRRVERPGPGQTHEGGEEEMEVIVTKESFSQAYPELFAEIQGESYKKGRDEAYAEGYGKGKADGAEAERNRIKEVEEQLIPGHEALIKELKFDGKTTGGEAAKLILKKESELLGSRAKEFKEEGQGLKVADAIPPEVESEEDKDEKKRKAIAQYQKGHPESSLKDATLAVAKEHPELFK